MTVLRLFERAESELDSEVKAEEARERGLTRRQRNIIHGGLLVVITVSLCWEGPKVADLGFLALSIVCEVWA